MSTSTNNTSTSNVTIARARVTDEGAPMVNSVDIANHYGIVGLTFRRWLRRTYAKPAYGWYFVVGSSELDDVMELAEEIAIRTCLTNERVVDFEIGSAGDITVH